MEEPLTDVAEILRRNALSKREEAVDSFLNDARKQAQAGAMVIIGGDFNEPSHLDWIEATRDSADHHGVVIDWPCTAALTAAGFKDAYRVVYPNPVTHPGYTYPTANPARVPEKSHGRPKATNGTVLTTSSICPPAAWRHTTLLSLPRGECCKSQRGAIIFPGQVYCAARRVAYRPQGGVCEIPLPLT